MQQADTIARTVATPLEQAINGVENMEYIGSQSTGDGNLTITVTFKIGSDVNSGLLLTNNRVQDTLSRLPDSVQRIGVRVQKVIPAYLLGIFPYSPHGARDVAYISNYMTLRVRDELSRLPGVGGIFALGERQFAMRIWIDPNKAADSGLVLDENTDDYLSYLEFVDPTIVTGDIRDSRFFAFVAAAS